MNRVIEKIHVSFGDWSTVYMVGQLLNHPGWGEITSIKFNHHEWVRDDIMTWDIYAYRSTSEEEEPRLAKKIKGLPVELTYKYEQKD